LPMAYCKEYREVSYKDSDVRDILINEGFYEVFSEAARKHLVEDAATGDKVFLLSAGEVNSLNIPESVLTSRPTRDAKEYTGIYINEHNDNTAWWLRTDDAVIEGSIVDSYGKVQEGSKDVSRPRIAVRPAIWVE